MNINRCAPLELETLPGVGPVIAEDIVGYRKANGPFRDKEDLKKIKGIKDGTFARIKNLITID